MKNSSRLCRVLSAVVCICVMLGVALLTRIELHGAVTSGNLLYFNDRAWPRESWQPIEVVNNRVRYIPVTVFAQFADCDVLVNEKMQTLLVRNGEWWISFDLSTDFAMLQDKTRMYIKTYEFHDERYVPAEAVCEYVHLYYESMVSPVTGETAIRIMDGNQKYTFEQLLTLRYPGFLTTETTPPVTDPPTSPPDTETSPPDTLPPDTEPPYTDTGTPIITTASPPVLTDRTVYLTIEDCPGDYTGDILAVLEEYGFKATFFVVGNAAENHLPLLSSISARGHAVALHTMSHDPALLTDPAELLAELREESGLLARTLRLSTHIWRAPEGSASLEWFDWDVWYELDCQGYVMWDYNVDVPSEGPAEEAAEAAITGIWENETPVLRFKENESTAEALSYVLAFLDENRKVCDVRTISPAFGGFNFIT